MAEQEMQKIIDVELSKEMKRSYIDYAMSVIIGRALPDVRDGLKPVHRRILYTMHEAGLTPDKPYKKCATTVGDVLGKYHPHGDASVYDALVRLAQDFSMRYCLVDGQGNFGSVDGDPPAAYRYTEARMSRMALEMLADIEKDTVDFGPNYDDSRKEPLVIPSKFPNLLVNGSSGIAVGMATNIPTHNLGEVIDGIIAVMEDPNITIDELMNYIKGPDFPTGGIIMGKSGIRAAYHTGRGRILIRARAVIEEHNTHQKIVVSEIPYQVNKAKLVEKIGELVRDKRVEGISAIRDESDREGMRIVIEVKRDANANVILNQLYKFTQMQESFCANMIALVNEKEPRLLNLREILDYYIEFQKDVLLRRTRFDLKKAIDREHILHGLCIAIDNIDEVINVIRGAKGGIADAKVELMERFGLTDVQAQAIVDMRLGRLSGLERQKIHDDLAEVQALIQHLNEILGDDHLVVEMIKEDLLRIKDKYG
ncbi:MAG TPA: DNA topoisomerase 4 subunit A, partial [Candidatus Aphodoplasma excrementigallinarum]|nr:DNA topoisomerase 4 subunit A [Candidatus Aphodoplasma excrementigallinarum]